MTSNIRKVSDSDAGQTRPGNQELRDQADWLHWLAQVHHESKPYDPYYSFGEWKARNKVTQLQKLGEG